MIDRIKLLIGTSDSSEDEDLISEIIEITKSKILNYINKAEIPNELEFVLIELAIRRFNRIGSEGIASESVDGRTTSYEDDFESYKQYLDDYMSKNNTSKGFRLI